MTRINPIGHADRKTVILYLLIILSLILMHVSTVTGNPMRQGKHLSSKTLRSMARLYMAYGEYAKAQPLAEQALALARRENAPDREWALCLIDLAVLYQQQNKLAEAENLCALGLTLQENILEQNHPHLAHTWRILAGIYQKQAKYEQAEIALDKALSVLQAHYAPDHIALAPLRVEMARLMLMRGDYEKSQSYYEQAQIHIENCYGPHHLYTAQVRAGLAELYLRQHKYDRAQELIERSIADQENIYGPTHHLVAPSWLTKAQICQARGDIDQAEKLIRKALFCVDKIQDTAVAAEVKQHVDEIRAQRHMAAGYPPEKFLLNFWREFLKGNLRNTGSFFAAAGMIGLSAAPLVVL